MVKYLILLILILLNSQAFAYDFLQDYKIMQDKMNGPLLFTEPIPKYFIKSNAHVITDYKHLQDEAKYIEENPSQENADIFLNEHIGRIKSTDAKVDIGFTLKEFNDYEKTLTWTSQIQFHAHWNLSVAIKNEILTKEDILAQFPKTIPIELKNFISNLPAGTDIISACRNSETLSFETTQLCMTFPTGVYIIPSSIDVSKPVGYYLYKEDYKLGSYNYWNYRSFFGGVNLYVLRRQDQIRIVNSLQIQSGEDLMQWKPSNNTDYLALDYTLGWRVKNHAIAINFTEMKLALLKKPSDKVEPLYYETKTQINLQTQSNYIFDNWNLMHFAGITNTGYDLIDSAYIGFMPTWNLKKGGLLGCLFMVDSYFYTIGPQYNFHGLNIQYQYKTPSQIHNNGLKPDGLQSLSLGLSF